MLDAYSYTAPARVKTLVVPIEGLPMEQFESYYNSSLSKYFEVRLVDVTPNNGLFNPQGYPHGRIIYDYQLVAADNESLFLQDFEPFRKIFNVLGLTSHFPDLDVEKKLSQLKKDHISAINHNIIVFDTPQDVMDTVTSHKNVFYLPKSQNITALETILCDITSNFLESLSTYASSYQHVTLRSPGTVGSNEVSSTGSGLRRSASSGFSNGHSSYLPSSSKHSSTNLALASDKKKKRISSTSFLPSFESNGSSNNQERLKANKAKGRQQKVLANFYMLSGRLNDALREFCDSIVLLKLSSDYLWLGNALDGLGVCIMMLTFLEVPFQLPSAVTSIIQGGGSSSTSHSTKEVSSLTPVTSPRSSMASISRSLSNQISSVSSPHHQASSSQSGSEYNLFSVSDLAIQLTTRAVHYYKSTFNLIEDYVPQIVYCETILRFVKFSSLIHLNGGLDFKLMKHIVKCVPLEVDRESSEELKAPYSIDKSQIAEIEREIFTSQFVKLDFIHKAKIYSCLISVSTDLKLFRRRSFLLKELFDLIAPRLNERRTEINTNLSSMSANGQLSVEYSRNKNSILDLIEDILKTYGISTDYPNSLHNGHPFSPNWIDLHLVTLKHFIDLTEKLGFLDVSIKYSSLLLKNYTFVLTAQEQNSILNSIKAKVTALHLKDENFELHYWDDYLARNISSVPAVNDLTPIKQNINAVLDPTRLKSEIYNPFTSLKDIQEELLTLVQEEPTDIMLTLQNPFSFDINVKNLQIMCNKDFKLRTVQFFPAHQQNLQQETQTDAIVIKSGQLIDLVVTIIPLNFGSLEISGIKAEVCDCVPQFFNISVSKDFKVYEKIKNSGFRKDNDPKVLYENDYSSIVNKSLKYHVLSPQPVLSLADSSLLNNSIMLLEGETKNFTITLQNNSPILINHLTSLFFDSTSEPLKKALTSKLPPNEIYEIEFYLLKKLPFDIINKEELAVIKGHQEFSIKLSLLGKRGMSYGSIMLEYGNVLENHDLEYVRRIDIPINITVYPSIEIANCDIIPIFNSGDIFETNQQLLNKKGRSQFWTYLNERVLKGENMTDYCLLLLDLRNSWTGDLTVTLKSSVAALMDDDMILLPTIEDNEDTCQIHDYVAKGKTERFLIPIKRIALSEEILATNIPSLRKKQFVVDNATPKEEQKFVREAFWYRQELLKRLQGVWNITGTDSIGDIELRGMRLSSRMLNILKIDVIEIEQKIYRDDKLIQESDALSYAMDLQEFYTIRTKITNRSNQPVNGMFRHIPMSKSTSISIDRKILFNGVLQYHLPAILEPDESVELELCICILENGEYEWGAMFDELRDDGKGNLEEINTHTQRRSLLFIAS